MDLARVAHEEGKERPTVLFFHCDFGPDPLLLPCTLMSFVLTPTSSNHRRYIIDGNKVIILREDVDQKVDDVTFEQGEVYSVDVAFSSGEGKPARPA